MAISFPSFFRIVIYNYYTVVFIFCNLFFGYFILDKHGICLPGIARCPRTWFTRIPKTAGAMGQPRTVEVMAWIFAKRII